MMIINPQEALEQYIGEPFIDWLNGYIPQEMQSWPIIQKIKTAIVKPEKLKKLMLQVFLANDAFFGAREGDPGFLRFAIANLSESDDPQAETALEILEKRRTDELLGHRVERGIIQTTKREKWFRLLKALGLTEEEIEKSESKEATRSYIAELSDVFSTLEWQTAMGAFAAMDRSMEEENAAIVMLLKNNSSLDAKEMEVLNIPTPPISHLLEKIAFDQEAKNLVWQGVSRQLEVCNEFLTGLEKYLV